MQSWYLIHTKLSVETLAERNLNRQGYEVYLPRALQAVRRSGQWRDRIVALFPRYLFLHLSEGLQALSPVHSTVGVADIVRFGSQYAIVPDRVIHGLRVRADPGSGLHRLNSGVRLAPGDAVRIGMGPFDGLEGVFEREAGVDRVVVLLKLLGQDASVCVSLDSIVLRHAV
jgi:transcriptional antiterminator RfaH